ncbi:PIN domain nuclease [Agrobacterium sp. BA1120]|uniref:type II toxin-antitoxin system VapC family toxin n=1 Tax=Agrobacterium sp. BA1120 TaxID=3228927 RepID=UPI003369C05B
MIVVDTSVWISLIRHAHSDVTERLRSYIPEGLIMIGDVILLEVLQGAQSDRHADMLERQFRAFPCATMSSPALALKAAKNYRHLRQRGITIRKTTDLIIGTYCIEHGHALLHSDRDFTPMAEHLGLRIA